MGLGVHHHWHSSDHILAMASGFSIMGLRRADVSFIRMGYVLLDGDPPSRRALDQFQQRCDLGSHGIFVVGDQWTKESGGIINHGIVSRAPG